MFLKRRENLISSFFLTFGPLLRRPQFSYLGWVAGIMAVWDFVHNSCFMLGQFLEERSALLDRTPAVLQMLRYFDLERLVLEFCWARRVLCHVCVAAASWSIGIY